MTFIPAEHVARAVMIYTHQGREMVNVLHFEHVGAMEWDTNQLEVLGADLRNWFDAHLKSRMGGGAALTMIKLQDLTQQNGAYVDFTSGLPISGTHAGEGLPGNVAMCVTFRTTRAGRSARGRAYMVGVTDEMTNGSLLDTGVATALAGAWGVISDDISEYAWHCVVSYVANGVPRQYAMVTPISSYTVGPRVDSQRRRLGRES